MSPLVFQCWLLLIMSNIVTVAKSQDVSSCNIPTGMYDNYPVRAFDPEPTPGSPDVCKVNTTALIQRIVMTCVTQYCVDTNCHCNSTNLSPQFAANRRQLTCYIEKKIMAYYKYQCCNGYEMINITNSNNTVVNRTCALLDKCWDNYLGCQYNCTTYNSSSYCTCPVGFQLNIYDNRTCEDINECSMNPPPCSDICSNTNGSYQCICLQGRYLLDDLHTCADNPTPQQVLGSTTMTPATSSFPYQYIIAIVVGSVLLIALVLLAIFCLACRNKRQPSVDVFFVDKEPVVVKKIDVDTYDENKLKKESDYATINVLPTVSSTPAAGPRGLEDTGTRATPNIYSSLNRPLPQVSDLNSVYAEIGDPQSSEL